MRAVNLFVLEVVFNRQTGVKQRLYAAAAAPIKPASMALTQISRRALVSELARRARLFRPLAAPACESGLSN